MSNDSKALHERKTGCHRIYDTHGGFRPLWRISAIRYIGGRNRARQSGIALKALLLAGGLALTSMAQASDQNLIALVISAAQSNHAVEGLAYNQPVTAVPIAARPCLRVGVIFNESTRHRRGPRIDHFDACPGEEPQIVNDVSPSLPDDRQFQQLTLMAVRGALRYGEQRADWSGYHVETRRLSYADPQGCAQVETIVVTAGLLVSYHVGRMCP